MTTLQGRGYLQRFERPGNVDTALELFTRALAQDPNYALAYAAVAEAYWRKYEATKDASWVPRAREAGAHALELSPSMSEAQITLAIIANGTGEYEKAVTALNAVLAREPTNADAYRELGRAYDLLGDFPKAEATLLRAVNARPGDWSAYNSLGMLYLAPAAAGGRGEAVREGRGADARQRARLQQSRRDLRHAAAVGQGLPGAGSRDASRSDRRALVQSRHRLLPPAALRRSGQGARARHGARIRRTIRCGSTSRPRYLWTPGSESKAPAAFAKAAELGEGARAVNPRDASLAARLANCYAQLNEPQKARAAVADAEKLGPNSAALLLLAQAYERLGDRTRALERVCRRPGQRPSARRTRVDALARCSSRRRPLRDPRRET